MMSKEPYKDYQDSGIEWIGIIPSHWKVKKISRLFNIIGSGTTPNSNNEKYFDGDIPWLLTGDLNDSYIKNTTKRVSEKAKKEYSALKLYPENSLVMAMYGATIGKLGITTFPLTTNQACCVMGNPNSDTNMKFVYYWLIGNRKNIISMSYGGGQPNISQATIKSMGISVPPIDEQDEIVNFLDEKTGEIQKLINLKKQQIQTLQQYRQSLITETVTKGLNVGVPMSDSGVEWIGEIPEHWELKKLKNMCEVYLSNVDKKSVKGERDVFLCNYVDVYYNDEISDDIEFMSATAKPDQVKKFTLLKDDVLITKDSESPTDIAVPSWVSKGFNNVLCGYHLALLRPSQNINGKYLFFALKSDKVRSQFFPRANGVTRFGLGKDAIKNGYFPVPEINEQLEIANFLTEKNQEISDMITIIKNQIEALGLYRQSLIYEAVTGKIDVQEMEVEACSSHPIS
jgi:type I restriction enzyme, S subunit